MPELWEASSAGELVPLDAEAIGRAAAQVERTADHLRAAGRRLATLGRIDGWKGAGGERFARVADGLPRLVDDAADVLAGAGESLRRLEAAVVEATSRVSRARHTALEGWEATRRWHLDLVTERTGACARTSDLDRDDPGAGLRARARAEFGAALADLEDVHRITVDTLAAAAELAPDPFVFSKSDTRSLLDFGEGFVGNLVGTAQTIHRFSPYRAVQDPDGYRSDVEDAAAGVGYLIDHPGDIDDVLLDLETRRENPEGWAGDLTATLLTLGVAEASIASRATQRLAQRVATRAPRLANAATRVEQTLTRLRLPSVTSLTTTGVRDLLRAGVDDARRVRPSRRLSRSERERLAAEHGGAPDDYAREEAEVITEAGRVTIEYTEHQRTGEVHDVRVLAGELPERG